MDPAYKPFVQLLIVVLAVIYGVYSGRAKAERLRSLGKQLNVKSPILLGAACVIGLFLYGLVYMAGKHLAS